MSVELSKLELVLRTARLLLRPLTEADADALWPVTEAGGTVLRFAFEQLGLHKVAVNCFEENAASRWVIEKLGFRLVGIRRENSYRDGRWWDSRGYELLTSEWRAMLPSAFR